MLALVAVILTSCVPFFAAANASSAPAAAPAMTPESACMSCVPTFAQCGGSGNITRSCCSDNDLCIAKNVYYAQCLPSDRADEMAQLPGWWGKTLACGEQVPDMRPNAPANQQCVDAGVTMCALDYNACGGYNVNGTMPCCHEGFECVKKNDAYAQCIPSARVARNVENGWNGTVLQC